VVHRDVATDPEYEYPVLVGPGFTTVVSVPMLRKGSPIGAITLNREEGRPFSDNQTDLLRTFAAQAVIAIENVRLFSELQQKNDALTQAHAQVTEALEQQTATAEILQGISSSPTDVQPTLDAIAVSATRLCEAEQGTVFRFDGRLIHMVAHNGGGPLERETLLRLFPRPPGRGTLTSRAILTGSVQQADIAADPEHEHREIAAFWGTVLSVPMLREGVTIGAITVRRRERRPFSDKQIELVRTFADQAVIAIENVRLFTALQQKNDALTQAHAQVTEALEQQTATADVLKVISRSTFDLQPVLETLIESAVRLCGADKGFILRPDGGLYRTAAAYGATQGFIEIAQRIPTRPGRESATGRAVLERRVIQIPDVLADPEYGWATGQRGEEIRTILAVPMLREATVIGVIVIGRTEVQPFSDKQIELVKTFADQAVIAVENVRLFQELKARNRELTETLEQQTATAEILRVIASSPTELGPVMEAVAENAARVCGALDSSIFRLEGEHLRLVARHGSLRRPLAIGDTIPASRGTVGGRAVRDRRTIQVENLMAAEAEFPETVSRARLAGALTRTMLATPLLREGTPLGVILINRGPEAHPFSPKQIALLETFANQAVIAIENVRLFQELEARKGSTFSFEIPLRLAGAGPS
jgi:GAF domain-containing protein